VSPEEVVGVVFGVDPALVDDSACGTTVEGWDSVGHVTLVLELESVYGITLSAEDAAEMTDVGAIKRVLERRGASW
jgi:acyl carrier protein